jgi:geranylgeranyl diphosphate synthase type II
MQTKEFNAELMQISKTVNSALKKFLPKDKSIISQTMRYAVLAGGKRLRPALVLWAGKICGQKIDNIMPSACAVEYLHTYSLVHDDLPAMDNDDMRRGRPTVHKKFGYAEAILCGDALLTESFKLISMSRVPDERIKKAVAVLADYAGFNGMIGGQAMDTIEAGAWSKKSKQVLAKKVQDIWLKKTADLIIASLKIGAVLSGAKDKFIKSFEIYGANIGCAFQITDDILDVYGDKKLLGKNGSDAANDKLTALSLYGKDMAIKKAKNHILEAKKSLKCFGDKACVLEALADFILQRGR